MFHRKRHHLARVGAVRSNPAGVASSSPPPPLPQHRISEPGMTESRDAANSNGSSETASFRHTSPVCGDSLNLALLMADSDDCNPAPGVRHTSPSPVRRHLSSPSRNAGTRSPENTPTSSLTGLTSSLFRRKKSHLDSSVGGKPTPPPKPLRLNTALHDPVKGRSVSPSPIGKAQPLVSMMALLPSAFIEPLTNQCKVNAQPPPLVLGSCEQANASEPSSPTLPADSRHKHYMLQSSANMWQYVAICGDMWQYVAICGNMWQRARLGFRIIMF